MCWTSNVRQVIPPERCLLWIRNGAKVKAPDADRRVTRISGKTPYRETRGYNTLEKGTANQQPPS